MKKILIDTGHPAQIHQFRHLAGMLTEAGYTVLFLAREKEIARYLLEAYKIDYILMKKPTGGIVRKLLYLPVAYVQYIKIFRKFRPDLILSRFSLQSSHLAWLLRIPHIAYTDSEFVRFMDSFTVPFVKSKITSTSYGRDLGRRHYRVNANTELFYLHPNRFKPDYGVLEMLGVKEGEPYAILRFISWKAHHDVGKRGLSHEMKERIVAKIRRKMKVFITSEMPLPPSLQQYSFRIPAEKMHDALALASLYVGEGITMTSEAAVLGTPAININPLTVGYVEDEAKAGLVISLRNERDLPEKLDQILDNPRAKEETALLRDEYLSKKCDPARFYFWLITNYPASINELDRNPDIANTF